MSETLASNCLSSNTEKNIPCVYVKAGFHVCRVIVGIGWPNVNFILPCRTSGFQSNRWSQTLVNRYDTWKREENNYQYY